MTKINIDFKNIEDLIVPLDEMVELSIKKENIDYYMKICLKNMNNNIVIFSNGAINPQIKTPPVYMRSSWVEDINASCIFLDDPTVHENNLRLGWGQGKKDYFGLEEIASILNKLFKIYNFSPDDIYFYGSSAGGFMSAYYSILIPKTTAIINNPQIKVLNYLEPFVKKMLKYSYNIASIEDVPEDLIYRLDLIQAMRHYNYVPKKLYYIQNYLQESDIETQLNPFLEDLKEYNINMKGLCLINYFHQSLGHNPLPQNISLKYIHQVIEGKLDMEF